MAISTVLHLCAIAILGLCFLGGGSRPAALVLNTSWRDEASVAPKLETQPAAADELQDSPGGTSLGILSIAPAPSLDAPHVELDQELHRPGDLAALSEVDLTAAVEPTSGFGRQAASGVGGTDGNARGDGTGTDFFGLTAAGERFVFVVDASGSMNRPFHGPGRTLLGRVKLELLQCVMQMTPEQQFFIVFFNDGAIPMRANRLMEATPHNQRTYLQWMAGVEAGGMTEPETALLLALRLNPDVIYFLTDGAFKYRVVGRVREMNRSGVTIHTVGFGDKTGFGEDGAERFMRMIAEQNGGTYEFVPAEAADGADSETVEQTAPAPPDE